MGGISGLSILPLQVVVISLATKIKRQDFIEKQLCKFFLG